MIEVKIKRIPIISMWLAVTLLIGLSSVALAATQTWDLDSDSIMYKGTHSESGTVPINVGNNNVWRAENAAEVDVPFTADTWYGLLKCQSADSNKKFTVSIGVWNGSSFNAYGTSSEYSFSSTSVFYFLSVSAFTVPQGQWLACKVANTGSVNFTIVTDGTSAVNYPPDEPDYPIPELPTIVILASGLAGLAGYLGFKRRKRGYLKVK